MDNRIKLQPLIHLDNMSTVGFEALYKKKKYEKYPSASYILKNVIGECDNKNHFQLFINMSMVDVISEDFINVFLQAMDIMKIDGSNIVLELSERTHPDLLSKAKKSLTILRKNRIKIALDDFGSAYSNLHFMHELPLDIIKIDKKFVQDAPRNKKAMAMLKFCIELSHDIGYRVVAEGIETTEQLECVRDLNADIGQGFLFNTNPAKATMTKNFSIPFMTTYEFVEFVSSHNVPAEAEACRM
ncbi:MAG: EAL domain-containing protein [Holosporaceae bacterium]|jgi:EAL domain-containing protein (putative c-di-GMP-specific phosphodiesterase class I)|nr:EAL domain-containing protein [Holosporaceae bacterium]